MNEYLKDNLILGDWLEIFFGSITLPQGGNRIDFILSDRKKDYGGMKLDLITSEKI